MATRYLLHFVHEHISFRWAEFLSLTSMHKCSFKLISKPEHIQDRPYIIIELNDETTTESLIQSARGSYLLKGLFELWGQSHISVDHLAEEAPKSSQFLSRIYAAPEQTFRVNCESFGAKLTQPRKVEWIKKMVFMETFESQPDLKNPNQTYCIFEMNDNSSPDKSPSKEYYFGRLVTQGNRAAIHYLNLKDRVFIANTSMDPMLSLIAANTAQVKPNDIVYDPFVGSGSLLVAAAFKGAYVLGADIDWKLLHGKSRPSRKGQETREVDENVRANLRQYNLEGRYLDVMVSDITRSPLNYSFLVDSIISDPPYGIRESSEKIGANKDRKPLRNYKIRYPSKTSYTMQELLKDLLSISARHLTVGGRLIYFLPVTKSEGEPEDFIPQHPCLQLISFSEQALAAKVSRLLVVMEKTRDAKDGDNVMIPQKIKDMNFRDIYFSKT